jgi:hypothetical protein
MLMMCVFDSIYTKAVIPVADRVQRVVLGSQHTLQFTADGNTGRVHAL